MLERLKEIKEISQLSSGKLIQNLYIFLSDKSWSTVLYHGKLPLQMICIHLKLSKKAFALCLGKTGIASREDIKVAPGVTENLVREIEKENKINQPSKLSTSAWSKHLIADTQAH